MKFNQKKLRELRREQSMTQIKLGRLTGFLQKDISQWERGKKIPTLKTITRLSDTLGVDPFRLLKP